MKVYRAKFGEIQIYEMINETPKGFNVLSSKGIKQFIHKKHRYVSYIGIKEYDISESGMNKNAIKDVAMKQIDCQRMFGEGQINRADIKIFSLGYL